MWVLEDYLQMLVAMRCYGLILGLIFADDEKTVLSRFRTGRF